MFRFLDKVFSITFFDNVMASSALKQSYIFRFFYKITSFFQYLKSTNNNYTLLSQSSTVRMLPLNSFCTNTSPNQSENYVNVNIQNKFENKTYHT